MLATETRQEKQKAFKLESRSVTILRGHDIYRKL